MLRRNGWVLGLLMVGVAATASAQGLGARLREKAKEKVEQRAEDKVDKEMDKALDQVECAISDKECQAEAKKAGKKVTLLDADGNKVPEKEEGQKGARGTSGAQRTDSSPAGESSSEQMRVGQGAWANYDFVPGNRILFADDFTNDRVGNFPRRLELGAGSMELVDWQGARFVRSNDIGFLVINLKEVLPAKFTFEVDVMARQGLTGAGDPIIAFDAPKSVSGTQEITNWAEETGRSYVVFGDREAGIITGKRISVTQLSEQDAGKLVHLRILADGNYIKVFIDEKRVANVPNANIGRSNKIYVGLNATGDQPVFFGNVKVAASDRDLYDALSADGRIAVQGIYFDTGSDRLRPESGGTLALIADMLKGHPDLRIMIEGHTDNVGSSASNKALSEKRAAAVKSALASQYGITASRLASSGFGDTKPAAPNTTPDGRQQNRRVELVKM
jgi:outer membrane protein OmpA-like peptidoglycan-associated protein